MVPRSVTIAILTVLGLGAAVGAAFAGEAPSAKSAGLESAAARVKHRCARCMSVCYLEAKLATLREAHAGASKERSWKADMDPWPACGCWI